MEDKTLSQIELENALYKYQEEERKYGQQAYAVKIVERVVFGLVSLILIAVMTAIIALVINKI